MNLPPLPELPEGALDAPTSEDGEGFSADQLRAYALSYGRAVQEACARECDELALTFHDQEGSYPAGKKTGAFTCAAAIRNGVIREGEGKPTAG